MTLNVVGIVCALEAEAHHLGPATSSKRPYGSLVPRSKKDPCGTFAPLADGTLLAVSGMGRSAAASASRALIDAGVNALVSWGMAGGLDPVVGAGTIFLPAEVVAVDGTTISTAADWRGRLARALAQHHPLCGGKLLTHPQAVSSRADKARLFHATGAAAVDMESLVVGELAAARHLPFIAIRAIVDCADDDLPAAVTAAADSEGRLHPWRLIRALALAPRDWPSLVRLAARYRLASRSLAAVARVSLTPYPHTGVLQSGSS